MGGATGWSGRRGKKCKRNKGKERRNEKRRKEKRQERTINETR